MEAPARPLKTPAPSLHQALKPIKKKPFFSFFNVTLASRGSEGLSCLPLAAGWWKWLGKAAAVLGSWVLSPQVPFRSRRWKCKRGRGIRPLPCNIKRTEGWQASLFPLQSGRAALPGCEAAFLGWKWCFHAGFCLQIIPLRVVPRVHSLSGVNPGRQSRQEHE